MKLYHVLTNKTSIHVFERKLDLIYFHAGRRRPRDWAYREWDKEELKRFSRRKKVVEYGLSNNGCN